MIRKVLKVLKVALPCLTLMLTITACKTDSETTAPEQTTAAVSETDSAIETESAAEIETADRNEKEEILTFDQMAPPEKGEEVAVMTTNKGEITIRFFPQFAPLAVENFVTHAKNGYFNGLTFHRVIDGFMIQGGDPTATGTGGESIFGTPFPDEFSSSLHNFTGALSMANSGPDTNGSQFFIVQRRVDASVNGYVETMKAYREQNPEVWSPLTGKPIMFNNLFTESILDKYLELGGTPSLDYFNMIFDRGDGQPSGAHTVFGQVMSGMEVVDSIAKTETDKDDKPIEDMIIEKVEIIKYGE